MLLSDIKISSLNRRTLIYKFPLLMIINKHKDNNITFSISVKELSSSYKELFNGIIVTIDDTLCNSIFDTNISSNSSNDVLNEYINFFFHKDNPFLYSY